MSRPHPLANPPQAILPFEFLLYPSLVFSGKTDWAENDGKIATVYPRLKDKTKEIVISSFNDCENRDIPIKLFMEGKRSSVGKGSKTVLDEFVRKSKEISAKHIKLEPEFKTWVENKVSEGALALNHPYRVFPRLYKLLIYGKDGKFKSHMDSPHSSGMIMTFSVDIWCGERWGGILQFESRTRTSCSIMPEAEREIVYHLFYHDVIHKSTTVTRGYKISLVFDVFEVKNCISHFIPSATRHKFINGISDLKKAGIKRVGFLLNHIYMCAENIQFTPLSILFEKLPLDLVNLINSYANTILLKGTDRIISMIAEELGLNMEIVKICIKDNNQVFDHRLISIFKLSDTFEALFNGKEEDSDIENEHYAEIPENRSLTSEIKFKPRIDKNNEFEILSSDCLLGDVFFVKTCGPEQLIYSADPEVHLGNNGFGGSIHSNLAIIISI